MPLTYRPAPAVQAVAAKLIAGPQNRLADEDIRYWFRSEKRRSAGRDIWGDAKKLVGLPAAMVRNAEGTDDALDHEDPDELLSAPMFVVVVPEDIWLIIDDTRREALVFDLLCRCRVEGSEEGARLTLVGPDLVEFIETIEAYGLWRDEVRRAAAGMFKAHPTLFDADEIEKLTIEATVKTMPSITCAAVDGEWAIVCETCGTVATDPVRLQLDGAFAEHQRWHLERLENAEAIADGILDDDGDEGAFGEAFGEKLEELAEENQERLKVFAQ